MPRSAQRRGLKVIIAGAGGAAHLPGMAAAVTPLPVLGVPVESHALKGHGQPLFHRPDAGRRPVGTLAIGKAGAVNAGLLAAAILALNDPPLGKRLDAYRQNRPRPWRKARLGINNAATAGGGHERGYRTDHRARRHDRHPGRRAARAHDGAWRRRGSAIAATSIARTRTRRPATWPPRPPSPPMTTSPALARFAEGGRRRDLRVRERARRRGETLAPWKPTRPARACCT